VEALVEVDVAVDERRRQQRAVEIDAPGAWNGRGGDPAVGERKVGTAAVGQRCVGEQQRAGGGHRGAFWPSAVVEVWRPAVARANRAWLIANARHARAPAGQAGSAG
jgi:hypothetical protein